MFHQVFDYDKDTSASNIPEMSDLHLRKQYFQLGEIDSACYLRRYVNSTVLPAC